MHTHILYKYIHMWMRIAYNTFSGSVRLGHMLQLSLRIGKYPRYEYIYIYSSYRLTITM